MNLKLQFTGLIVLVLRITVSDSENNSTNHASIIFDRRQNGNYNIQINIKDMTIIEMHRNEYRDRNSDPDDYYYDESELTVKPWLMINSSTTTAATLNNKNSTTTTTTTTPTTILTTIEELLPLNSTENVPPINYQISNLSITTTPHQLAESVDDKDTNSTTNMPSELLNEQINVTGQIMNISKIANSIRKYQMNRSNLKFNLQNRKDNVQQRQISKNLKNRRNNNLSFLKRLFSALSRLNFDNEE